MKKKTPTLIFISFLVLLVGGFFYFAGKDFLKFDFLSASINSLLSFDKKAIEASLKEAKSELQILREENSSLKEKLEIEIEINADLEQRYQSELDGLAFQLKGLSKTIEEFDWQISQLAQFPDQTKEFFEQEIEEGKGEEEEELKKDVCLVNLNTASKEELEKLIGIGPVMAQRIIDSRPFLSIYELTKVSGIGETTLQKIIDQDCVFVENDTGPGDHKTVFSDTGTASVSSFPSTPKIILSFLEENPVNKEIEVNFSASNLKSATYDIKISIEKEGKTISDIFNEKENIWSTSYHYLPKLFSGTSFSNNFKLKIKDAENDFRGQTDIIARVRESGKSGFSEFKGKINITDPLIEEKDQTLFAFFTFFPQDPFINQEIVFDASSSTLSHGQIFSYLWDFGDGNLASSTQSTTTYSYSTSGEYLINLWIIDDQNIPGLPATATINIQSVSDDNGEENGEPINLLKNEFFEDWDDPGTSAIYLNNWEYSGTAGHIVRNEDALVGNYSLKWAPITTANNLIQNNVAIMEPGTYYVETWIKSLGVDDENYLRISLDIADPIGGSFPTASFINYTEEEGWIKITKVRNIEAGDNGGIRIRAQRSTAITDPGFLIGAAWLGTAPPPENWPQSSIP